MFKRIIAQFLRELHVILKWISSNFWENFAKILRKFHSILNKILLDLKENFMQFLREFIQAGYTQLVRSLQNVFAAWKHASNETCIEVYSHCCGHFMRQISRVSHFELFHAKSCKIMKSKGFSRKKIFNEKIVRTAKLV